MAVGSRSRSAMWVEPMEKSGGCRVFTSCRLVHENGLSRPSEESVGSTGSSDGAAGLVFTSVGCSGGWPCCCCLRPVEPL